MWFSIENPDINTTPVDLNNIEATFLRVFLQGIPTSLEDFTSSYLQWHVEKTF